MLHESHGPLVNVLVSDSPEEAQDAGGRGDDVGPGGTRGVKAPAHLGHLARLATEEEGNGSDPEPLHLVGMVAKLNSVALTFQQSRISVEKCV